MMAFMIEQEFGAEKSLVNIPKLDEKLEKGLDEQIFRKFMALTRLQATIQAVKYCDKRLQAQAAEDKKLIEYATFLKDRHFSFDNQLELLKIERKKKKERNKKLQKKLLDIIQRYGGVKLGRSRGDDDACKLEKFFRENPGITKEELEQALNFTEYYHYSAKEDEY